MEGHTWRATCARECGHGAAQGSALHQAWRAPLLGGCAHAALPPCTPAAPGPLNCKLQARPKHTYRAGWLGTHAASPDCCTPGSECSRTSGPGARAPQTPRTCDDASDGRRDEHVAWRLQHGRRRLDVAALVARQLTSLAHVRPGRGVHGVRCIGRGIHARVGPSPCPGVATPLLLMRMRAPPAGSRPPPPGPTHTHPPTRPHACLQVLPLMRLKLHPEPPTL